MGLIKELESDRGRSRIFSEISLVFCISKLWTVSDTHMVSWREIRWWDLAKLSIKGVQSHSSSLGPLSSDRDDVISSSTLNFECHKSPWLNLLPRSLKYFCNILLPVFVRRVSFTLQVSSCCRSRDGAITTTIELLRFLPCPGIELLRFVLCPHPQSHILHTQSHLPSAIPEFGMSQMTLAYLLPWLLEYFWINLLHVFVMGVYSFTLHVSTRRRRNGGYHYYQSFFLVQQLSCLVPSSSITHPTSSNPRAQCNSGIRHDNENWD